MGEEGNPHTSLPVFFWRGENLCILKSFVMGEGGYTNELIVGLETYMTGGQGAPGSQDALTSTQGGREGQSLIPRRE